MQRWKFLVQGIQRHRVRPRPLWGQGWRKGVLSLKKKGFLQSINIQKAMAAPDGPPAQIQRIVLKWVDPRKVYCSSRAFHAWPESIRYARAISATLHAWAMHPLG